MRKKIVILGVMIILVMAFAYSATSYTSLFDALKNGTAEDVKELIEAGADVNVTGDNGWSPLMNAIGYFSHDNEMVKILIDAGADVNARNIIGRTALMMAVTRPLKIGINNDLINDLIDAGAELNARDRDGQTVLIMAAINKCEPEVFSILLSHGADYTIKDNSDKTAMDYAKENNLDAYWLLNDAYWSRKVW